MAARKKDYVSVNMRMDKEAYDILEEYCEISGQTRTMAIERAVKKYAQEIEKNKKDLELAKEE